MRKLALALILLPSLALAEEPAHYCDSKSGKIRLTDYDVTGPDWSCKFGDPVSGLGTGLAGFNSTCKGRKSGLVIVDGGNYQDHYELHLPWMKKDDWIPLYCNKE